MSLWPGPVRTEYIQVISTMLPVSLWPGPVRTEYIQVINKQMVGEGGGGRKQRSTPIIM